MTWEQLALQMGISGLVITVGYKIALVLITAWQKSDEARTKALIDGDAQRTLAIREGFSSVTDVHARLLDAQQKIAVGISRLDAKISAALDLTPAPTTIPPGIREAIETPSRPLEEPEPPSSASSPGLPSRRTPPGGYKQVKHKTSG